MPLLNMQIQLWSSEPTRFGDWAVKLSLWCERENFIVVAKHVHTREVIIKNFIRESDVVDFVNFLGEKL